MKELALLFLLVVMAPLAGQQSDSDFSVSQDGVSSYVNVHLVPLTYLAEWSRLRAGVTLRKGHYGYTVDLEYGNSATHGWVFERQYREYQFFGLRLEKKKYFGQHAQKHGFAYGAYLSAEAPLNFSVRTVTRQISRKEGYFNIDRARERRIRTSLIIKTGHEMFLSSRLILDLFFGVGAGFQSVVYFNEIGLRPADTIREYSDAFGGIKFYDRPLEERNRIVLEMALGIRLGYRIGRL